MVSAGSFAVNLLARGLSAQEFGAFVLLYGVLLTLQLANTALVFYPLSIRLGLVALVERPRLFGASLILALALSVLSSLLLSLGLAVLGFSWLILPSVVAFLTWQIQEAFRRSLLALFRIRTAVLGDGIPAPSARHWPCWPVLASHAEFHIGPLRHGTHVAGRGRRAIDSLAELRPAGLQFLRGTAAEFWRIGGIWSVGDAAVSLALNAGDPLVLAVTTGMTDAVASLQAATNIANLSNPILIGLCNIIPQTVAQGRAEGARSAWKAARVYILLGLGVLLPFAAFFVVAPGLGLRWVDGADSPDLGVTTPLRILMIGSLISYAADMVISYL